MDGTNSRIPNFETAWKKRSAAHADRFRARETPPPRTYWTGGYSGPASFQKCKEQTIFVSVTSVISNPWSSSPYPSHDTVCLCHSGARELFNLAQIQGGGTLIEDASHYVPLTHKSNVQSSHLQVQIHIMPLCVTRTRFVTRKLLLGNQEFPLVDKKHKYKLNQ